MIEPVDPDAIPGNKVVAGVPVVPTLMTRLPLSVTTPLPSVPELEAFPICKVVPLAMVVVPYPAGLAPLSVPVNITVAPALAALPATSVPVPPIFPESVRVPEPEAVKVPVLDAVKVTGLATFIDDVAIKVPPVIVNKPCGLLMLFELEIDKVPVLIVVPPVYVLVPLRTTTPVYEGESIVKVQLTQVAPPAEVFEITPGTVKE